MGKSLWSIIFGSESGNNSTRGFEFGGTTKSGEPWYVKIGEKIEDGVKKLNK